MFALTRKIAYADGQRELSWLVSTHAEGFNFRTVC